MNKKTIKDLKVKDKTVLVRCDFNVPQDKEGNITDDRRIKGALNTIQNLKKEGAKVLLISHLGRPKGKPDDKLSLKPVADRLKELLGAEVKFFQDEAVISEKTKSEVSTMKAGDIGLLENIRFRKEETDNDDGFAKELSSLGDLYVNDAFGTSHRAHASNFGLAKNLPSAVGFLVEKELEFFTKTLENPKRPFVAIVGGAKVSDKIGVINNLLGKVDQLIIGGGMAYTFLKAKGYDVGKSLLEEDKIILAKELMQKAKSEGVDLILPVDTIVAREFDNDAEHWTVEVESIPEDTMGLDIGKASIELFDDTIQKASTIIWNGPMGVFEMSSFEKGTKAMAKSLSNSHGVTIIGGGDSAAAVEKFGFADQMNHISTGGGASLELLEGKILPGIDSIEDR
ncbi:phosphoglycerate kinase [Isachenkonia alkalipeptolytica]|uniref:Phosphoglycerate kinase n=1 Tax=Isachenkonia alkalipeptolytica TaxID=2565777 RepID=A0AA43XLX7_9CLOT|nr:phosphoglycerate kinase [Isachenkonia alkalipeptolytica]NBG89193.1 phosphoglycerate kinase [Isachenkonia alkalipeptolytica]